ncbi:unnamed protein product [Clonostachys byssicola]|uniref:Major facilitator superfamily (MFS) profile domain-containing protein n=1 Tax=Clonostachys byssicola TaxID=160290 RepID=A0A9N9Y3R8_9HYPO|nr:unnamed protein product [Clonostachys byssicola]
MAHRADEESPLLNGREVHSKHLSITTSLLVALLLGELMSHAETTLMFTTSALIASEFARLEAAVWLVTAYTLGVCAAQPLYGKLSDIFGRKAVLLCAYSLSASGCIICGSSPSIWMIIVGRAVSGLGGAGLMIISSIIITDSVPKSYVAQYRSYINIASTLGRGLGGPLGGYILDNAQWRWLFFSRVPVLCILAAMITLLFDGRTSDTDLAHDPVGRDKSFRTKLREIDYIGAVLLSSSITIANVLINGDSRNPLGSGLLSIALVAGLSTFAYFELCQAHNPIINLRILTRRNVAISYIIVHLQVIAQMTLMFSVPIYFQVTRGESASASGMRLVPAIAANTVGALLAGRYIRKARRFRSILLAAGPIGCLSYILVLSRWDGSSKPWESLYVVPGGAATGMATSAAFISMTSYLEQEHMAVATGIFFLVSSMGSSFGVSVDDAITQSLFKKHLLARLQRQDKVEIIRQVTSDIRIIANMSDDIRGTIIKAFVDALRATFVFGFILSLVPSLAAIMVEDAEL